MGVDTSLDALTTCRRAATVPVAASDLRALAVAGGTVVAYVSLGVVEHDLDGPDAILAEAYRVLEPGGVLIISVPYLNGVRRLGAPWIRRRQLAVHRRGGAFYQYAFTRREFLGALRRQGFQPLAAHPYDPARLLRSALARLRPRAASARSRPPAGPAAPGPAQRAGVRQWLARVVRRALYTEPGLRFLGHMLLVVARRP